MSGVRMTKALARRTRAFRERLARFISPELAEEADSASEPHIDGGDWIRPEEAKKWIDLAAGRLALSQGGGE